MKRIFPIILLTVQLGFAFTVTGNFVDRQKNPISDAMVDISRGGEVLGTARSDSSGGFTFDLEDLTGLQNEMAASFELQQNYPNPFNPSTHIMFSSPESGMLVIYDILGRRITSQSFEAGACTAIWGGVNDRGILVSAGVYFYTMRTASRTITRKMVLLDKGDGTRLQIAENQLPSEEKLKKTAAVDSLTLSFTKEFVSNLNMEINIIDNGNADLGEIEGNILPHFVVSRLDSCLLPGTSIWINLDSLICNDEKTRYQLIGDVSTMSDSVFIYLMETDTTADFRIAASEADSDISDTLDIRLYSAVTDIDGNLYRTVRIGKQVWMAENFRATHYSDGSPIPNVLDGSAWGEINSGIRCYYDNDSTANAKKYGALYNWYTVVDGRSLAPDGWHVATDDDWKTLEQFLGMDPDTSDRADWRGTDEGRKLKSASGWDNDGSGTDVAGFCAVPAGHRSDSGWIFSDLGTDAIFWSATAIDGANAWGRNLFSGRDNISRYLGDKAEGFSVRMIKGNAPNQSPVASFSINPQTGNTDTLFNFDASGSSDAEDNIGQLIFRWDFESDGVWDTDWSSEATTRHQFAAADTYLVRLEVSDTQGVSDTTARWLIVENASAGYETMTDIDGNVYRTVTIGNQVWMAEDLRVTHYRDGRPIPNVTDSSAWGGLTTGALCFYNNDSTANAKLYGALYNWYAVNGDTDGDGLPDAEIAPAGWRIPSQADWLELTESVGGTALAGKNLKSTTGWMNNGNGIDAAGFTAVPAGRCAYGNFLFMGSDVSYWTLREIGTTNAYAFNLSYDLDYVRYVNGIKSAGFSLRCIKGE